MTKISDLHHEWMADADYRRDYEALDDEFSLAQAMIEARTRAGLTQQEVAARMETSQSAVARLESGRSKPSARTLAKFAQAIGARLNISFEPVKAASTPRCKAQPPLTRSRA